MTPIDFPERNRILHGQRDEQGNPLDDVMDLPTWSDYVYCVCCWQLTDEERQIVGENRKLWIHYWGGPTQPPVHIGALTPLRVVEPKRSIWSGAASVEVRPILWHDREHSISLCELTEHDAALIAATGRMYVSIQSGFTHAPIGFSVLSPLE